MTELPISIIKSRSNFFLQCDSSIGSSFFSYLQLSINSFNTHSVSSVLNKEVRSYGKKFLYDDCDETCWNSDSVSISMNMKNNFSDKFTTFRLSSGFSSVDPNRLQGGV